MSNTAIVERSSIDGQIMEKVVTGDLSGLNPQQRSAHLANVCESIGLNPLTAPFQFVSFQGRVVMYATKSCTEQLRKIHNISLKIVSREITDDIYIVTAMASMPNGRTDESVGAVNVAGLKGDAKANAIMKCETKAKRRVTLSICGLGYLDESELETIAGAKILDPTEPAATPPAQIQYHPEPESYTHSTTPPPEGDEPVSKGQLLHIGRLIKQLESERGEKYGPLQLEADFHGKKSTRALTQYEAWFLIEGLLGRLDSVSEVSA